MSGTLYAPGDLIDGRYRILGFHREGGMQEVYRAEDTLLQRIVALKSPKNDSANRRFKGTAVISAQINHRHVAKTLDYIEDDRRPALVEEFIEGEDLQKILQRTFVMLAPSMAARVLHQMAKGLLAAHNAGVIHRDLKPSNLMIEGGASLAQVKITDFGISKMAEEEIRDWSEGDKTIMSKTVFGAIPYMAPESIRSFRASDQPSDVWALGAMTYEMLTGQKPFGEGLAATAEILSGRLPSRPAFIGQRQFKGLGVEIFELLCECMSQDPALRPTASGLVSKCEALCYPQDAHEFGSISVRDNQYWGFIQPDDGGGVFWHRDSFYGPGPSAVGQRVCYVRHTGAGNDRAFPLVIVKH